MPWVLIIIAALFEIAWAIGLKFTDGLTRLWPTLGTLAALVISIALLGIGAKSVPIGTAYAIWTGIGAVGTVLCGMLLFGDSMAPARVACLLMIVCGIIGLKLTAP